VPESAKPQIGTTQQPPPALAPAWHTATLIGLIIAVAATGTMLSRHGVVVQAPAIPVSRSSVYAQMILVAWSLLFYVGWLGQRRNVLPALVGQTWHSVGRAGTDLLLAASVWLFIKLGELAWLQLMPASTSTTVATLLPHTGLERLAWVGVSVSVGFSEEVVYRGYLQTQLAAFTGRASWAWVLQAVLFGLAHGEQGPSAMVRLAIYGLALGALARFRQSLLPGIACHVWTNVVSGLGSWSLGS
jgi:membrane protease YdiL (CAAX protease family)